jgi:SAM-dependent methyltransferase
MNPADPGPHVSLERMNRFQEREARRIIGELGLSAGSRGLDVGCGVGLYALWLAEAVGPGGRVVAIEPDLAKVEAARALVGGDAASGRLEFQRGDGTAIPLADGSLDWVWCGDVLHHIVDTEKALREFVRVVRPGGRVIVKESQVFSAMFLPGHPELERRIQLAEIRRSLDEAGLEAAQTPRRPRGRPLEHGDAPNAEAARLRGRSRLHPAHRLLAQLGRSTAGAADPGGLAGAHPALWRGLAC